VLSGKVEGRESRDEITLFKAVGLAVQDLASARYIFDKARNKGVGAEIEIGGMHFADGS
jgi:ornithine cyclodeaminase/alanine dehydrogenase-like protein (mu-crystallin family)